MVDFHLLSVGVDGFRQRAFPFFEFGEQRRGEFLVLPTDVATLSGISAQIIELQALGLRVLNELEPWRPDGVPKRCVLCEDALFTPSRFGEIAQ